RLMTRNRHEADLLVAVLDALTSHICVLDASGTITLVNEAWRRFSAENGGGADGTGVGSKYLEICGSAMGPGADEAPDFAQGVRAVLEGRSEMFQLEYPCHSPTEDRWFVGRVTPLGGGLKGAVVSHQNVTDRKRVEFRLARLAATDALTGLANRRYFFDVAAREVERVKRFRLPASLVMTDIDHFKSINDTYGHAAGDEALREVASVASAQLREPDVLARLGGEEFALLLPGVPEAGAAVAAERLRRSLSEASVLDAFRITASFGVSEILASDAGIDDALARADAALYAAKQTGRNRVVTASDPPDMPDIGTGTGGEDRPAVGAVAPANR
ncbi:MAG: diguanylate cyclase, partial [Rhizobiales bacterium]|nr:diguanylate cyclase [Hyphomicrobiales bacterium]